MRWYEGLMVEVSGERFGIAIGADADDSDRTGPTDIVIAAPDPDAVILFGSGAGIGSGVRLRIQRTRRLRAGEFDVRARCRGGGGAFGIRAVDPAGDTLVEDVVSSGRWAAIGARWDDDREGIAARGIFWEKKRPAG